MPNCAVKLCRKTESEGITYHKFPKDPARNLEWKEILNIEGRVSKGSRVCSKHFEDSSFYFTLDKKRQLLSDAVPTLTAQNRSEHEINDSDSDSDVLEEVSVLDEDNNTTEEVAHEEEHGANNKGNLYDYINIDTQSTKTVSTNTGNEINTDYKSSFINRNIVKSKRKRNPKGTHEVSYKKTLPYFFQKIKKYIEENKKYIEENKKRREDKIKNKDSNTNKGTISYYYNKI